MASFDIIESSGKGYALVWAERKYLLRLALVPILMKFTCLMVLIGLDWQTDMVRHSLVMLPSYFFEGWLFAHLIRLIYFEQRWPFRPTGNAVKDMRVLEDRARGVTAGTLTYVVVKFLVGGFIALAMTTVPEEMRGDGGIPTAPPVSSGSEPGLAEFFAAVLLIFIMLWAFRLLWLYIPAAINCPLREYLRKINGFSSSFYLLGTWLVCYVPLFFLMLLIMDAVFQPLGSTGEAGTLLGGYLLSLFHVVADTVIAMIATAGLAYGIRDVLRGKRKKAE